MAIVATPVKRKYLGNPQKGVAQRNTDTHPVANASFVAAIKAQQVEVRDLAGNVLQAALVAGNLEEEIVYTGVNVSDAPSTNPGVMNVVFTFIGNGECSAKVNATSTPDGGKSLRIVYNTMRPYLSIQEIEARTYACGEEHLFQGYHMTGAGDDSQRSDSTINAHQLITYM
jgi:hypothetical protein